MARVRLSGIYYVYKKKKLRVDARGSSVKRKAGRAGVATVTTSQHYAFGQPYPAGSGIDLAAAARRAGRPSPRSSARPSPRALADRRADDDDEWARSFRQNGCSG